MTKRKIVIKVNMPDPRSRSRAMVIAAKTNGVGKIEITGSLNDQLEVVGEGINIACLVKCLSKKLCHAEILKVEEVKPEEKKDDKKKDDKKEEPKLCPCPATPCSYYHTPLHIAAICDDEPRAVCHIL
ncbi:unnamed protein product [Urochloa humidicola]